MYQDLINFSNHEIVRQATPSERVEIIGEFKRIAAMHNKHYQGDPVTVNDLIAEYCGTEILVGTELFLVTMNKFDANPYAPTDNIEYYLINE